MTPRIDAAKRNHMMVMVFKAGYSIQEVADAFGVDAATLEEVLRMRVTTGAIR